MDTIIISDEARRMASETDMQIAMNNLLLICEAHGITHPEVARARLVLAEDYKKSKAAKEFEKVSLDLLMQAVGGMTSSISALTQAERAIEGVQRGMVIQEIEIVRGREMARISFGRSGV